MHSPVSTQAFAHLRAAGEPSPAFRMSMTPSMTAPGSACTPPGPVTGQTSTHLPQRVQASSIASTRWLRASSKLSDMPASSIPALLEIAQIRRGLVLAGGHQPVVAAAEIDLVADLGQARDRRTVLLAP